MAHQNEFVEGCFSDFRDNFARKGTRPTAVRVLPERAERAVVGSRDTDTEQLGAIDQFDVDMRKC
jgi:hypothetical protein